MKIQLTLPDSIRLELCIHACACDLTLSKLLESCAHSLVENGRPAGWEDLSPQEEAEALKSDNSNLQLA